MNIRISGAVGGKTGKTAVVPGFCKIERGGGAPPYYWSYLARARAAAAYDKKWPERVE